jgi:hypothetical protein
MDKIIENATIIYRNGQKEIFDAITLKVNGIYTGHIKLLNEGKKQFINHSYIPKDQVKKISFLTDNGKIKDIDLKENKEENIK